MDDTPSYCNYNYNSNCGCPNNEGGYCTDESINGNTCIDHLRSCETNRPCLDGWLSSKKKDCGVLHTGKQCQCCINNYDKALGSENKLKCCLGSLSGSQSCAPGWCPKSISNDCDDVMKTNCVAFKDGEPCKTYCNTIPSNSDKPRKENSLHWCNTAIKDYCSIGDNILNDDYCVNSIAADRNGATVPGKPPSWSVNLMNTVCHNHQTDKIIPEQCNCILSKSPVPSCIDPLCIRSSYKTPSMVDNQKKCPSMCLQIIDINKAGGNVNIHDNDFSQNCEFNDKKIISYYELDNDGKCVLSPDCSSCINSSNKDQCLKNCKTGNKQYPDDPTCGNPKNLCQPYIEINKAGGNINYDKKEFKNLCDGYDINKYYECDGSNCIFSNDCSHCFNSTDIQKCIDDCVTTSTKYTKSSCNGECACDDYIKINKNKGNVDADYTTFKQNCDFDLTTYYQCKNNKCEKSTDCTSCFGRKDIENCIKDRTGNSIKYNISDCDKKCLIKKILFILFFIVIIAIMIIIILLVTNKLKHNKK